MPSGVVERAGSVQSVDRAMQILETVALEGNGLRLADVAQTVGLPISTTHRLLTTLEGRRFVHYDARLRRWRVGLRSFQVGSGFAREAHYAELALPFLQHLRRETDETVNLGVQQGEVVVILSQLPSSFGRAVGPVGARLPMDRSGLGKAMLASRANRAATGGESAGHPSASAGLLPSHDTGAQHFAVDHGELARGIRCVAAAVCGYGAEPIGAISVSGNAVRITDKRLPELGTLVADAATGLTAEIARMSGQFSHHGNLAR